MKEIKILEKSVVAMMLLTVIQILVYIILDIMEYDGAAEKVLWNFVIAMEFAISSFGFTDHNPTQKLPLLLQMSALLITFVISTIVVGLLTTIIEWKRETGDRSTGNGAVIFAIIGAVIGAASISISSPLFIVAMISGAILGALLGDQVEREWMEKRKQKYKW